ncbi:MAG: hypothetical protein ACFFCS_01880 [Candidatus Hodarchaeota archaeon]
MTILNDDDAMKITFKGWETWKRQFVKMLSEYKKAPDIAAERRIVKNFMENVEIRTWNTIKDDLVFAIAPEVENIGKIAEEIMVKMLANLSTG